MMNFSFDPGFAIYPKTNPMGFEYGPGVFGPGPEIRTLDAIRPSLLDPDCEGPGEVYAIVMDVGKEIHREILNEMHLLYGVVTYANGRLGREPIRSQGHIHKESVHAGGWSTPEVYEIWSGEAIIYMQEKAEDNPGRCFAVYGKPGDVIIVPPFWAHATISANPDSPLTFGAWCDRDFGFEYSGVRQRKGLAFYPLLGDDNKIRWQKNPNYQYADLLEKTPELYTEFGIEKGVPVYRQFESDTERFNFVPRPDRFRDLWKEFLP